MKYIVGISEIVLWTADKEKALHFYHDELGFEVISLSPKAAQRLSQGR